MNLFKLRSVRGLGGLLAGLGVLVTTLAVTGTAAMAMLLPPGGGGEARSSRRSATTPASGAPTSSASARWSFTTTPAARCTACSRRPIRRRSASTTPRSAWTAARCTRSTASPEACARPGSRGAFPGARARRVTRHAARRKDVRSAPRSAMMGRCASTRICTSTPSSPARAAGTATWSTSPGGPGVKGISVIGTGDFTHPAWREELSAKLVPAEPGLFRLRPDLERAVHGTLPPACRTPVRFMLSSRSPPSTSATTGRARCTTCSTRRRWTRRRASPARSARIGNLAVRRAADPRARLAQPARDHPVRRRRVPTWCPRTSGRRGSPCSARSPASTGARTATPISPTHIFAIETGLSSDPAMNWRVSSLDRYRLVSNSDAHSPPMLGREATAFD